MVLDMQGTVKIFGTVELTSGSNSGGEGGVTFNGVSPIVDDGTWGSDNTTSNVKGLAPPPLPPAAPQVSLHANNLYKLLVNANNSGVTINGDPVITALSAWMQQVPGSIPVGPALPGVGSSTIFCNGIPSMVILDLLTTMCVVTGAGAS